MAKPRTTTPPVTGQDAVRIEREIQNGTPNTAERIALMRRADEAYRQSMAPLIERRDR